MGTDDRERSFEKALGRALKGGEATGMVCPDAETLAAYHERMLSPEEMGALKSHIAACPSCQEVLATLEVTEVIPGVAEDSERVVVRQMAAAPASVKGATVREMPKAKTYPRWVVPAAAIAAGVLVWIAVANRPATMMSKHADAPVEIAENRQQAASPQLVEPQQKPLQPPAEKAAVTNMADREVGKAKEQSKDEMDAFKLDGSVAGTTRAKTSGAYTYNHGPRAMQNQVQNQVQNQIQNGGQANGQLSDGKQSVESKRIDEVPLMGRDVVTLAQNAPRREAPAKKAAAAPAPAPRASAGVGGAAGAATGSDTGADANEDLKVGRVSENVEVQAESAYVAKEKEDADKAAVFQKLKSQVNGLPATAANLRAAKSGAPGFVASPDPKVFWYFTPEGLVLHSDDGGKTTKQQKAGEGLKFIAGSAPDTKTCWLLAEKGIVVRTTNGGKKWTSTAAPANQNFSVITGIDAKHALITDTTARVSYSTADGGATWAVVPQP